MAMTNVLILSPQGCPKAQCWGPFSMQYTLLPWVQLATRMAFSTHRYTGDTQLYVSSHPDDPAVLSQSLHHMSTSKSPLHPSPQLMKTWVSHWRTSYPSLTMLSPWSCHFAPYNMRKQTFSLFSVPPKSLCRPWFPLT